MLKNYHIYLLLFSLYFGNNSQAQHAIGHLIPAATATHTAVQSGDWFDENTWGMDSIPSDAAIVVVPAEITVNYEGESY